MQRVRARPPVLHLKVFLEELEFREAVKRIPTPVGPVAILVDPEPRLTELLLVDVAVYEAHLLAAEVLVDGARVVHG